MYEYLRPKRNRIITENRSREFVYMNGNGLLTEKADRKHENGVTSKEQAVIRLVNGKKESLHRIREYSNGAKLDLKKHFMPSEKNDRYFLVRLAPTSDDQYAYATVFKVDYRGQRITSRNRNGDAHTKLKHFPEGGKGFTPITRALPSSVLYYPATSENGDDIKEACNIDITKDPTIKGVLYKEYIINDVPAHPPVIKIIRHPAPS